MKIQFSLIDSDKWNHHETSVIDHASLDAVREDFNRVLELHLFRSNEYKRDYIARWGQEQYDKSYPAPTIPPSSPVQEKI